MMQFGAYVKFQWNNHTVSSWNSGFCCLWISNLSAIGTNAEPLIGHFSLSRPTNHLLGGKSAVLGVSHNGRDQWFILTRIYDFFWALPVVPQSASLFRGLGYAWSSGRDCASQHGNLVRVKDVWSRPMSIGPLVISHTVPSRGSWSQKMLNSLF